MKLNFGLCALSVVAMLAAAPSAMAAGASVGVGVGATAGVGANGVANGDASATTSANANASVSADGGVSALGVNISAAGDTSTSVQSFNNNLTTEQQANIQARCKTTMAHPDMANSDVLAYCKHSMI